MLVAAARTTGKNHHKVVCGPRGSAGGADRGSISSSRVTREPTAASALQRQQPPSPTLAGIPDGPVRLPAEEQSRARWGGGVRDLVQASRVQYPALPGAPGPQPPRADRSGAMPAASAPRLCIGAPGPQSARADRSGAVPAATAPRRCSSGAPNPELAKGLGLLAGEVAWCVVRALCWVQSHPTAPPSTPLGLKIRKRTTLGFGRPTRRAPGGGGAVPNVRRVAAPAD